MDKLRGRRIALLLAATGAAVLFFASIISRERLREEWLLYHLKTRAIVRTECGNSAQRSPFNWRLSPDSWLVENGSVRTAGRLIQEMDRLLCLPEADRGGSDESIRITSFAEAIEGIVRKKRREIVPLLVEMLEIKPRSRIQQNQIRIYAAIWLYSLGRDASAAVPALKRALNENDEMFRQLAREALDAIRAESMQENQKP